MRTERWGSVLGLVLGVWSLMPSASAEAARRYPHIVVVTVDTLRIDRLSGEGYQRPTTPNMDRLLASGARFREARTVEPLTAPALASLWTSVHPHAHGATRNGLRMRSDLPSVGKILARRGYRTAAFVGSWTLKDKLTGLGEHFQVYREVLNRKRWLGLFKGEATAQDLNEEALAWLDSELEAAPQRPFLLWVHYVEPHAPYRMQEAFRERLGIPPGQADAVDRYDSEIAYADHHIGRLLEAVFSRVPREETLAVLTADHGESLGEHGYWGHGRHLYEVTLRVPMGISWPGTIPRRELPEPFLIVDVAPTLLGLLGLPVPAEFTGYDWTPVLRYGSPGPRDRITFHQAHKGAIKPIAGPEAARRRGLLEVGRCASGRKEILRVGSGRLSAFDLRTDPMERRNTADGSGPSDDLTAWLSLVERGLELSDQIPTAVLDPEDLEQLRALGYLD